MSESRFLGNKLFSSYMCLLLDLTSLVYPGCLHARIDEVETDQQSESLLVVQTRPLGKEEVDLNLIIIL